MWADYGQDLVAKSSSAAMRPMSLSSINCHGSCRSRSLPVPAVAATVAQASAALTGTEPLGRFAGRRGLGERDSRPLREAVGELVAAIPFSLKPVHGRTCPKLRAAQAHQQEAIDQLKAAVQSYLHVRRVPGHRARRRCPARARHQSGPRVSGDQRDSHRRTTRLQLIGQYRRASCGPAPASSGGC